MIMHLQGIFICISALVVGAAVMLHYEGLLFFSRSILRHFQRRQHYAVLIAVFYVIFLHFMEVIVFAAAYYWLDDWPQFGKIQHANRHDFLDFIYFSAMCFSSIGSTDLTPQGSLRFLVGLEGITGLVLIGWSTSFTYMEMQKYWKPKHMHNEKTGKRKEQEMPEAG